MLRTIGRFQSNLLIANTSKVVVNGSSSSSEIKGDKKDKFVNKQNQKRAIFKSLIRPNHYFFSKFKKAEISNELSFFIIKTR